MIQEPNVNVRLTNGTNPNTDEGKVYETIRNSKGGWCCDASYACSRSKAKLASW